MTVLWTVAGFAGVACLLFALSYSILWGATLWRMFRCWCRMERERGL